MEDTGMIKGGNGATVFVVDDDEAVRDSLYWIVKLAGLNVETYVSAGAFLEKLDPGRTGCLVLDVKMPEMDGLQLQTLLAKESNPLPIIFISAHGSIPDAVDAMHEGAVDFLVKPFDSRVLLERIRSSIELDRKRRGTRQRRKEIAGRMARLTSRERQVMDLIVRGHANKVVAAELGISIRTIEVHRARVMEKLGARSLAGLIHLVDFLRDSGENPAHGKKSWSNSLRN